MYPITQCLRVYISRAASHLCVCVCVCVFVCVCVSVCTVYTVHCALYTALFAVQLIKIKNRHKFKNRLDL